MKHLKEISKNRKTTLAVGLLGLVLSATPATAADAVRSLEGGHAGNVVVADRDGKKADLILKKIPGRGSSMIGALLLEDDRQVYFYQVDFNLTRGDWVMIPITATRDGEVIAAVDTNPSLTLKKTVDSRSNTVLEINSANSPNRTGFVGVVNFPEKTWWRSEFQWQPLKDGVFTCKVGCEGSATVSVPMLAEKNEASITLRLKGLAGDFRMRLKTEEIFALNAWSEKDTGSEQAEFPNRLAISVRKGGKDLIILTDPQKPGIFEMLERK